MILAWLWYKISPISNNDRAPYTQPSLMLCIHNDLSKMLIWLTASYHWQSGPGPKILMRPKTHLTVHVRLPSIRYAVSGSWSKRRLSRYIYSLCLFGCGQSINPLQPVVCILQYHIWVCGSHHFVVSLHTACQVIEQQKLRVENHRIRILLHPNWIIPASGS